MCTLLYVDNQMLVQQNHDKLATAFSLYFTTIGEKCSVIISATKSYGVQRQVYIQDKIASVDDETREQRSHSFYMGSDVACKYDEG